MKRKSKREGAARRRSRQLSWLLRHGAGSEGLSVDPAGWVSIAEVLGELRMSRAELDAVVSGNNKARFEVDGDRIRASLVALAMYFAS